MQRRNASLLIRFCWFAAIVLMANANAQIKSQIIPGLELEQEGWQVVKLPLDDGPFGGPFGRIIKDAANPEDQYLNSVLGRSVGKQCRLYEGYTWHRPLPADTTEFNSARRSFDIPFQISMVTLAPYGGVEMAGPLVNLTQVGFVSGDGRVLGTIDEVTGEFDGLERSIFYRLEMCLAG